MLEILQSGQDGDKKLQDLDLRPMVTFFWCKDTLSTA
jgi:hypothetical protein